MPAVLACLCLVWMSLCIQAVHAGRPNILHIHADDLRADGLHALGNRQLKTPNLDALVARGLTFTHCYTQGSMIGAVCLPSRTMMLTGRSWLRIPTRPNGQVDATQSSARRVRPESTLPGRLSAVGYETWHMGKGGNEFKMALDVFDTNIIDDGAGAARAGSSRRHADRAIEFLKTRQRNRPFYMYLAPPVPHDPRVAEPEFMNMYKPEDIQLSKAFMPLHPFDNGEMTVRDEKLAPWPRTEADTRRQLAEYYATISCLDHHVGRIFKQLEEAMELQNTIIIFTSDNGLSMGEHGLFGKQNLYEYGGMHVPMVIAGPGIPHGQREALVYLMDLFPTLCEWADAPIPVAVEGVSLKAVIEGQKSSVRETLVTGYRDCQRSIRDQRWKLIRYPQVNVTQLFDLQVDPLELNNLAGEPEQAKRVEQMMHLLAEQMQRYDDAQPLVVADPKPAQWQPPR